MSGRAGGARLALGSAAGLGLLADLLFPAGPQGPGFALWMLALGLATVALARRVNPDTVVAAAGWSTVAISATAVMVLRDAEILIPALWLVLFASASMVLLRAAGVRLWSTRPVDHLLGLVMTPVRAITGVVPFLMGIEPPQDESKRRLVAVARGALLAAPLLLVFGALFASADAGFDRYVVEIATFWSEDLLSHLAVVLFFGWIAAGLLSGVRAKRMPDPLAGVEPPRVGAVETGMVLGLLALLFLAFVGFQLGYLFGGREVIEATSGLTVAEYARRGFFELMVVGLATIGVLLVGDALTTARRMFRGLATLLVICVLVILTSAVQRLVLYTDAFGLTVDRITALAVMVWVAAVLVLFAATVLRERRRHFSSGAVIAGIVTVFALALLDPGAVAARSHLDRAAEGVGEADVSFLTRLSADAAPVLVERSDELPPAARCELAGALLSRWSEGPDHDWRLWNRARAKARAAVRAADDRLRADAAAC